MAKLTAGLFLAAIIIGCPGKPIVVPPPAPVPVVCDAAPFQALFSQPCTACTLTWKDPNTGQMCSHSW